LRVVRSFEPPRPAGSRAAPMTTRRRVKLALEFVQPMPLMIWAAMLLELLEAIMEDPVYWLDVGVLIVLQLLNVVVGFYEELQVRAVSMAPLPSSMSERRSGSSAGPRLNTPRREGT
jgi:hypothetical protein